MGVVLINYKKWNAWLSAKGAAQMRVKYWGY